MILLTVLRISFVVVLALAWIVFFRLVWLLFGADWRAKRTERRQVRYRRRLRKIYGTTGERIRMMTRGGKHE